jgi:hypothetical protein
MDSNDTLFAVQAFPMIVVSDNVIAPTRIHENTKIEGGENNVHFKA